MDHISVLQMLCIVTAKLRRASEYYYFWSSRLAHTVTWQAANHGASSGETDPRLESGQISHVDKSEGDNAQNVTLLFYKELHLSERKLTNGCHIWRGSVMECHDCHANCRDGKELESYEGLQTWSANVQSNANKSRDNVVDLLRHSRTMIFPTPH
jgi:hypothetical protein